MPPHSLGSGTISFGLVSIPVRLYTAASSGNVSFNQLHGPCGSRIRQQTFCPKCNKTVERAELVRGYEFAKDQYVQVKDEELKALEGEASKIIDIGEFVPLAEVDPIYFEKTYYLGPDKGGEKAYRLLADAMEKAGQVALAKYVMRGKESLVLIRAAQGGLMLHTMYFADEVRNFDEVDKGQSAKIREGELDLALQLINGLARETFSPDRYTDEYRHRVLEMVNKVGSAFYGPVLAVFALGALTRGATGRGALLGLGAGLGTNLVLARFAPGVSWLWWNPSGFLATASVALALRDGTVNFRWPGWPRDETRWLVGAFVAMLALLAVLPDLF